MDNQHKQIKGYRDLSQEEIDLMNKIKALAEQVGELVEELRASCEEDHYNASGIIEDWDEDKELVNDYQIKNSALGWVYSGKEDLQVGFMKLIRAVAKPTTF